MNGLSSCVATYVDKLPHVDISTIDPSNRRCPFCYDDFGAANEDLELEDTSELAAFQELPFPLHLLSNEPVRTPCGHLFGRTCLMELLSSTSLCPLYRQELNTYHLPQEHKERYENFTDRDALKPWHEVGMHACKSRIVVLPFTFQVQFSHFYNYNLRHVGDKEQQEQFASQQTALEAACLFLLEESDWAHALAYPNNVQTCLEFERSFMLLMLTGPPGKNAELMDFVQGVVHCAFKAEAVKQLAVSVGDLLACELQHEGSALRRSDKEGLMKELQQPGTYISSKVLPPAAIAVADPAGAYASIHYHSVLSYWRIAATNAYCCVLAMNERLADHKEELWGTPYKQTPRLKRLYKQKAAAHRLWLDYDLTNAQIVDNAANAPLGWKVHMKKLPMENGKAWWHEAQRAKQFVKDSEFSC
jgi:hypothetical protein